MKNVSLDEARSRAWPWLVAGSVVYLIDGPIIHSLHRQAQATTRSLLLRLLLPIGGGLIGGVLGGSGLGVATVGLYGVGLGMIAAAATDWITSRESSNPTSTAGGATGISARARLVGLRVRF